jgi:hypothetical protein
VIRGDADPADHGREEGVGVTEALSGALTATQARLTSGIADAQAELERARARCKELRAVVALARAQADAAPITPAPRVIEETRTRATPAYSLATPAAAAALTSAKAPLPRPWVQTLLTFRRLDVDAFSEAFAPNAIFHWEGDNALAGMHLGRKDATAVATRIAQLIEPRSVRTLELGEAEGTLEVLARVVFGGELPHLVRLQTRIHCVFRFDDAGRVALLYATPDDAEAVDAYLKLAVAD